MNSCQNEQWHADFTSLFDCLLFLCYDLGSAGSGSLFEFVEFQNGRKALSKGRVAKCRTNLCLYLTEDGSHASGHINFVCLRCCAVLYWNSLWTAGALPCWSQHWWPEWEMPLLTWCSPSSETRTPGCKGSMPAGTGDSVRKIWA